MAAVDYCADPVQAPPEGQTSNLVDPVNLSIETLTLGPLLEVLTVVFLCGRLLMNWKKLARADYVSVIGFILSSGYTATVMALHKYSRHMWDIPACWYLSPTVWKLLFASNMLLGVTQFILKLAILLLYFQLFAIQQRVRRLIIAVIIFSGLIYLPHPVLVVVFQAPHIGQTWTDLATDGMPQKLEYYAPIHGIGSIIIDVAILVIPLPVIKHLKVSRKKKIQLGAVFITGSLGVISSIVSCYWRFKLLLDKPGDQNWQEAQLFLWIMVEHNVALMVGCMPAFAGFLNIYVAAVPTFFQSLRSKILRGSHSGSRDTGESLPKPISCDSGGQRGGRKPRTHYYELNDTVPITQTDIYGTDTPCAQSKLTSSDGERGIIKTVDLYQASQPHSVV